MYSRRLLEYPKVFRKGDTPGPSISRLPIGSSIVPKKVKPVLAPLLEAELPRVSNSVIDM